jgi:hypothetical protein
MTDKQMEELRAVVPSIYRALLVATIEDPETLAGAETALGVIDNWCWHEPSCDTGDVCRSSESTKQRDAERAFVAAGVLT